jgi:plastocyanin
VIRLGAALIAVTAVLGASASAATRATSTVTVANFSFSPTPVMINRGDTVHWVWANTGGIFHSTTSGTCAATCNPDGKWDSGETGTTGHTFDETATFAVAGTYHYYCSVHLGAMQGDVIVNSPTSVTFTAFRARRVRGGVAVSWRTASDDDVAAYRVYRQAGTRRVAVGPLFAARAQAQPASYRLVDSRAGARPVYWLRLVHTNGARTWFGTAVLRG